MARGSKALLIAAMGRARTIFPVPTVIERLVPYGVIPRQSIVARGVRA